jgi:ABC-type taurine transport system ATPase subunit
MTEALGAADEIVVLEGPPVRITHRLKLDELRHKRDIAALEAAYGEVLGTIEKQI